MKKLKALILLTSPFLARVVKKVIIDQGHECIVCTSMSQARTNLKTFAPDVVFSDREFGGERITNLIPALRVPGRNVHLCLMASFDLDYRAYGANNLILKGPAIPKEIAALLERLSRE